MKKKRSSKRRARRAAVAKARAATAAARQLRSRRRRRRPAPAAGLGATSAAANPSRKYWRVGKRIPWKNPSSKYWRVGQRKAWKNPRRRRRNPPAAAGAVGGLMADFAGLGAALAAIGKQPMGLAWAGGGAALTAVGGNLVAAQVGRVMPAMGPGMVRIVNAAVFAGVAVGASRLVKDPLKRRQMMAGGLAVAAIELLAPGKTAAVVAKVPGLNRLLPAPAIGPDPAAMLAAQRGMSGLGDGDIEVAAAEPIAVDGIADDGDDQPALPAPEAGNSMGELVPTYLDGLGCPLTGRSNDLTRLVTP